MKRAGRQGAGQLERSGRRPHRQGGARAPAPLFGTSTAHRRAARRSVPPEALQAARRPLRVHALGRPGASIPVKAGSATSASKARPPTSAPCAPPSPGSATSSPPRRNAKTSSAPRAWCASTRRASPTLRSNCPASRSFAEAHGLEDERQAEQIAAYRAEYGRATERLRRRARLIARQLEALRWLENLVARRRRAEDSSRPG